VANAGLPDITVYLEALERRVVGQVLEKIRLENIFVLRTAVPRSIRWKNGAWSRCGESGSASRLGSRRSVARAAPHDRGTVAVGGGGRETKKVNALAHFVFPNGTLTLTRPARNGAPRCM